MNSMESQSSRHYNAQEQGNGSYLQHDRTPPISHGSGGGGQPMSGHSQTSVVSGYGSSSHRGGGGGGGSGSVKLPPSMLHSRTAPQEVHMRDGNMIVSVDQIIMKLDMASEENVRLRNTIHANNQLLDQKLKQFEPIIAENQRLKEEIKKLSESSKTLSDATYRFFEARVAVMGFKCRTMQLQGELDELKKKPSSAVDPDEYGRLRQHLDRVLRDNKTLDERCKALSSRAQPGGMDQAVKQLEHQVGELNRSILSLTNEKKSHETIIFQLQQDLKSVQDKKQLAEEERNRAQGDTARLRDQMQKFELDNRALSRQLEQLHGNVPPDSSSVRAQYESQSLGLQARVQELTEHISKLDEQVAAEKRLNEQLHGKIAELQEAKSAMRSKLQSYTGSETPPRVEQARPTPTPRTNLQPAVHALQADKERLEAEIKRLEGVIKQLQERLDTTAKMRTTAEEQFQQSSQKAQGFAQDKYQLERQIEAKNNQISEQQRAYQSLEQEFKRVRREKDQMMTSSRGEEGRQRDRIELLQREKEELRSQVAHWEMVHAQSSSATSALEREKLEHRGKIARLEEQLRQMQLESPGAAAHEMTSMKSKTAPLAKRLNDALGRIRELETVNRGLEDKQAQTQQEFQSIREENRSLRNKVEVENESLRLAAENESAAKSRQIDELRAEQSRLCEDKFKLQRELEHVQGDLENKRGQERQLAEQLQSYERQLAEKTSTAEELQKQRDELRAQVDSTQQDKDKKNNKLSALQNKYTDTKKRLDETKSEKDRLQTTVHQLEGEREQLTEIKRRIEGEKNHLEKTVKEYRTESESILTDYSQAMAELRQTKDEKENLQQMFTKSTHDLSQQRERSRQLEVQRKEVQDKLSHMDAQLKLYHEDFERERHAREAAIKVKNLAEERMKKMERDMKELRDRLNQQAARRLREDQYDDQQGPTEYRKSGEQQFSGSQPSNLTEPNRFGGSEPKRPSGGHPYSGGQQESPPRTHSGHQQPPSGQPQHMLDMQSPGAPPIPPKGTPPSAGVGAFGMGGAMGGAIGGPVGGATPLRASASDTSISGSPGHMGGGVGGVGGGVGGVGGGGGAGGRPPYAQTTTHYSPAPPRTMDRVNHPSTMMVTGHNLSSMAPQDLRAGGPPLRASAENQYPPFPGPSSQSGMGFGGGGHARPGPPPPPGPTTAGSGLNNLDGPGINVQPQQAGHFRAGEPMGPGGNPPNQLNNLNQLLPQGDKYVAPGEVLNEAPPSMACPLCGKADFKTQTDLELHCAQCN